MTNKESKLTVLLFRLEEKVTDLAVAEFYSLVSSNFGVLELNLMIIWYGRYEASAYA